MINSGERLKAREWGRSTTDQIVEMKLASTSAKQANE